MAGFGGGEKIILPGVCSIETAEAYHCLETGTREKGSDKSVWLGIFRDNPLRLDMEEAARMAGLDIKIDCIVNTWGETVAVFAGAPKEACAVGVRDAETHYLTPKAVDKDIVIANTFAKANETEGGLIMAFPSVSQKGGDIVLIGNTPEGHCVHYLMGPFGKYFGGKLRLQIKLPPNVHHLIVFNEYPDLTVMGYFADPDKVLLMSRWDDVLQLLQKLHGDNAGVAVYPNAEIQYFA